MAPKIMYYNYIIVKKRIIITINKRECNINKTEPKIVPITIYSRNHLFNKNQQFHKTKKKFLSLFYFFNFIINKYYIIYIKNFII